MGAIPPLRYYLERELRDMGGYLALGRKGGVWWLTRIGLQVVFFGGKRPTSPFLCDIC